MSRTMSLTLLVLTACLVRPAPAVCQAPVKERPKLTPVVGHRGLLLDAPENTLANCAACIALNVGIELDIRRSKDGHLICIHDPDVKRTTDGQGPVSGFTLGELRKLDAGRWFDPAFASERVPTLDEVFALVKQRQAKSILLALDLKIDDATFEADIVHLSKKYDLMNQVICIGRAITEADVRKKLRGTDPKMPVAVLAQTADDLPGAMQEQNADWIYIRFIPSPQQVARIHEAGKRVFLAGPTVVGLEIENWRRARAAGVDVILTDYALECRRFQRVLVRP